MKTYKSIQQYSILRFKLSNNKNTSNKIIRFCKNNFIYILVGLGFLGFCITMILYFNSTKIFKTKDYTFHELKINRSEIIDSFNANRVSAIAPLLKSIDSIKKEL